MATRTHSTAQGPSRITGRAGGNWPGNGQSLDENPDAPALACHVCGGNESPDDPCICPDGPSTIGELPLPPNPIRSPLTPSQLLGIYEARAAARQCVFHPDDVVIISDEATITTEQPFDPLPWGSSAPIPGSWGIERYNTRGFRRGGLRFRPRWQSRRIPQNVSPAIRLYDDEDEALHAAILFWWRWLGAVIRKVRASRHRTPNQRSSYRLAQSRLALMVRAEHCQPVPEEVVALVRVE
jgi:hypothetical protein